ARRKRDSLAGTGGSLVDLQSGIHDLLRFAHDGLQVALTPEALSVDLVNVLGAGRPGCEPSAGRHDLEATDRRIIARGARELGGDGLGGQRRRLDVLRREVRQPDLLLRASRRIDAGIAWRAELLRQLLVVLPWVLTGTSSDLGRQQVHDRTVLVRGPHGAVMPQKARARAFLSAEAVG